MKVRFLNKKKKTFYEPKEGESPKLLIVDYPDMIIPEKRTFTTTRPDIGISMWPRINGGIEPINTSEYRRTIKIKA